MTAYEDLKQFGTHQFGCPRYKGQENDCTCGFTEALERAKKTTDEADLNKRCAALIETWRREDGPPLPESLPVARAIIRDNSGPAIVIGLVASLAFLLWEVFS